jgi:hypothetical protein
MWSVVRAIVGALISTWSPRGATSAARAMAIFSRRELIADSSQTGGGVRVAAPM